MVSLIIIVVFFLLLLIGVPVAFSLGIATFFGIIMTDVPILVIFQRMLARISHKV